MGRSYKENPYKFNRQIAERNRKKNKGSNANYRQRDNKSSFDDIRNYHESFAQ